MNAALSTVDVRQQFLGKHLYWVLPLIAGLMIPLFAGVLLPLIGISDFQDFVTMNKLILMMGALIGGCAFWWYTEFVIKKPYWMIYFLMFIRPALDFATFSVGVDLHARAIIMMSMYVPMIVLLIKYWVPMWTEHPIFKWYVVFMIIITGYYYFYNDNIMDPHVLGGGSISGDQLSGFLYNGFALIATAAIFSAAPNVEKFFDRLTWWTFWYVVVTCAIAVLGYPIGLFTMEVDGFIRSCGIYSHPNELAHYMGMVVLYLLGLWGFYTGPYAHRMPKYILPLTFVFAFGGLLVAMSKTALATTTLCCIVYVFFMRRDWFTPKNLTRYGVPALLAVPVLLFGIQLATGKDFIGMMGSRFEQTGSYDWRQQVWAALMANMTPESMIFGHGFTSSCTFVYQLMHHDVLEQMPLIHIHNQYIQFLYDFGFWGLTLFVGLVAWAIEAIRDCFTGISYQCKSLMISLALMCFYFLLACSVEEYAYSAKEIWVFGSLAFGVARLHMNQDSLHRDMAPPEVETTSEASA